MPWFWRQNATIYDNQQNIVGEIKQEWRCGVLRFNLNLPGLPGTHNIIIKGPDRHVCCLSYIGDDSTFEVFSAQKDELTGTLEQTRIGIYRLYSTPAPFHDSPAVLRLETKIQPSPEFQGVLVAVGTLLVRSVWNVQQILKAVFTLTINPETIHSTFPTLMRVPDPSVPVTVAAL